MRKVLTNNSSTPFEVLQIKKYKPNTKGCGDLITQLTLLFMIVHALFPLSAVINLGN